MNSNNKNQNKNNAVFDSGCSNSSKKLITVLSTIMHYKNIQNNDNNYYISWKLKKYINKKLQELNPHSKNIELALNFLKRNSSKQLNIIDNSMAIKKVCNKLKNFDTIAQNNKINKKVYKPRYYKLLVIKHIIEENNNIKKRDKKHLLKNIDRKNTNISTENENSVSSIDNNSKCSSLLYTNQDLQSWYLEKHNNRLQTPKNLLKNIDRKNTNISTENENSVSSIDNNSKCSSLLYTNQDLQSWYLEKHNNRLQTPKK